MPRTLAGTRTLAGVRTLAGARTLASARQPQPPPVTGILAEWSAQSLIDYANNDPISLWPDSSGLHKDATSTGTKRGLFVTSWTGGRPAVSLDGSDDDYTIASLALTGSNTIYWVCEYTSPVTNRSIFGNSSTTGFLRDSTANVTAFRDDASVLASLTHNGVGTSPPTPTATPLILCLTRNGTTLTQRRNGVQVATVTASTGTCTINRLFQRAGSDRFLGKMALLRLYSVEHDLATIQAVEAYYAWLYSITLG